MIDKSYEEREEELDKEFRSIAIKECPGTIMLALGLYGKFGTEGNAFHPLLDNPTVVNALLAIGGVVVLWGAIAIVKVSNMKKELLESKNN